MFMLKLGYLDIIAVMLWVVHVAAGGTVPGEISDAKCKEYARYAPSSDKCSIGQSYINIFAIEKEFPHMVMLGYRVDETMKFLCASSLISEEFVLAPAHCLLTRSYDKPEIVRLGNSDLSSSSHRQEVKIKEVILHPEYHPPMRYNDIGLLKLENKVNFNEYVRPVCLHAATEIEDKQLIGSGWGTTEFAGSINDMLQKILLHPVDYEKCNQTYQSAGGLKNGISRETMLCAASNATDRFLSTGDLQILHKKYTCMYDLIGIGSFGKPTGRGPEVYTRISAYLPWIEDKVWK